MQHLFEIVALCLAVVAMARVCCEGHEFGLDTVIYLALLLVPGLLDGSRNNHGRPYVVNENQHATDHGNWRWSWRNRRGYIARNAGL